MSKKEFLKELESKLLILSDNERRDIINEYKDIIDEKVKNGENESDAIKDFGDIDTLAKEILSAYKIDVDYLNNSSKKSDSNNKSFDFEGFIANVANKISDFTKEVIKECNFKNHEITLEYIFEILIKVIILLVICAVMKLPFYIINELGESILSIAIHPLDRILYFIWTFITSIIYLVACVFVGIAIFKEKQKDNVIKDKSNKKINKNKEEQNVDIKDSKKKLNSSNNNSSSVLSVIIILLKVFAIILTIPLIFMCGGLFISLLVYVGLIINGLKIFSVLLLLIGLFTVITSILSVIYNALFNRKSYSWIGFIIGIIITIIGGAWTINDVLSFSITDDIPSNIIEHSTYEKNITINDLNNNQYSYQTEIDDSMADDELVIKIKYYNDFLEINGITINENYIDVDDMSDINNKQIKQIIDIVIKALNNHQIYLIDFADYDLRIVGNEKTINKINNNIEESNNDIEEESNNTEEESN